MPGGQEKGLRIKTGNAGTCARAQGNGSPSVIIHGGKGGGRKNQSEKGETRKTSVHSTLFHNGRIVTKARLRKHFQGEKEVETIKKIPPEKRGLETDGRHGTFL